MRADFANQVARTLDIRRNDLIEKDVILHQILADLSKDGFFSRNFVFKGGTCLIKAYFGYVRFSEDIDFTWKNQRTFKGKSQSRIRDYLSGVIYETGKVFEGIAAKRGFEFKCQKSNRDFVELGGSNKNCTFKIWYASDILKRRGFVKVQINFVEQVCFRPVRGKLNSLTTGKHDELNVLFAEYKEYSTPVTFSIYDIREILGEKVRALLTREGTKARDFIDVYLIFKRFEVKPEDVEACILNKMKFTLRLYSKYRSNLKEKTALLNSGRIFDWGREKELLLSEIDERDFYSFLNGFQAFLRRIVQAVDPAAELKEASK
jgi:predicted nucleotidyltransferase component of viral defense system